MICVIGSWDEVLDRMEAYIAAGARTVVIRFASTDQFGHLEACADALKRRRLLAGN